MIDLNKEKRFRELCHQKGGLTQSDAQWCRDYLVERWSEGDAVHELEHMLHLSALLTIAVSETSALEKIEIARIAAETARLHFDRWYP